MYYVDDDKKYVVTYRELILTFIVFCIILFVLYPKDLLKEQILSERSNYDLSMLYLKNMLKNDPSNESLMLALATQSLRSGKKDLAFKLLELLKESKDKEIRKVAYLKSYNLTKENYYYFKNSAKKEEEKEKEEYLKLKELFSHIMKHKFYDKENADTLYHEALFLEDKMAAYRFAQIRVDANTSNIVWLQEAFYLADSLQRDKDTARYLDLLFANDKENEPKWLDMKYYLLLKKLPYAQALQELQTKAKTSPYWRDKLTLFYLSHKEYKNASNLYMQMYKADKKKEHFFKAIDTLRAGGFTQEAGALAYAHEEDFMNDKLGRIYLLKLYLACGELERARVLSEKILQKERR